MSLTNVDQLTIVDAFNLGGGITFETVEVSELLSPGAPLLECALCAVGGRSLTISCLGHPVMDCERE